MKLYVVLFIFACLFFFSVNKYPRVTVDIILDPLKGADGKIDPNRVRMREELIKTIESLKIEFEVDDS